MILEKGMCVGNADNKGSIFLVEDILRGNDIPSYMDDYDSVAMITTIMSEEEQKRQTSKDRIIHTHVPANRDLCEHKEKLVNPIKFKRLYVLETLKHE